MQRAVLVKSIVIGALAVLILLPVSMIRDLIGERQARRDTAVAGIALGWGQRQVLTGPYLALPYEKRWIEVVHDKHGGTLRERRIERRRAEVLRLGAEQLEWTIEATTHARSRGIYRARLYTAIVTVHGSIAVPPRYGLSADEQAVRTGAPRLVLGVADPRGVRAIRAATIDEAPVELLPGPRDAAVPAGLHALPSLAPLEHRRQITFSFSIELAGSEALSVVPLGRESRITLRADWPHPSFQGAFLPARHTLRNDGFEAQWRVSRFAAQAVEHLAACPATGACRGLADQALGVSFIEPVGVYQRLDRASKYAFLFVGLVFAAFFLFELARRLAIHPIQYALVGLALAIFFLLLTALSEHIAFGAAYAIAAAACIGLITAYLVRALASPRAGLAFGAALALLYATLYLILNAEDYALLSGAVLLFALLATAMLSTRRIDWSGLEPDSDAAARRAGSDVQGVPM